jgi:hypothetical protein
LSSEIYSVVPSEIKIVPKSSRHSTAGFFLGTGIPTGEYGSAYTGGLFVGGQFGSGLNPGFLAQFGCVSFGMPGSATNNLTLYGTIGARFATHLSPSSAGIFITPSFGVLIHGELQFAIGISIDIYVIPKVILGTKFLTSLGSVSSSYSPAISFISFAVGYGVN